LLAAEFLLISEFNYKMYLIRFLGSTASFSTNECFVSGCCENQIWLF